ncbi:MAG: formate dehydrogenase accessory protein FdhE [Actinomycetota bacterium]|nr:formate dehydrogenase accessory protein FdhE [Actinomycetota bacterium]
MAIRVETEDPGAGDVGDAVERYKRSFPDYAEAIDLYGAVMKVQQESLPEIECTMDFSALDIEKNLREGRSLLDPSQLDIPIQTIRRVLGGICSEVERQGAAGSKGCEDLVRWEGLGIEGFQGTRDKLLRGERLELNRAEEEGAGAEFAAGIIWESLVPFYRKCARGLQEGIDHALWQKGFCPICGIGPLMGKFRRGDGMWLLECRLCHTLWNVRRAECPFCSQGVEGSLEYIYLEGHDSYRAYYCSRCKRYVKNVDLRSAQNDALLPLDNIVTELMGLDRAAEQEGLNPA